MTPEAPRWACPACGESLASGTITTHPCLVRCPCGVPIGAVGFEHRDDCPLRSRYFIFVVKATGQQVEWCDECEEWLVAGGRGTQAGVDNDEVEMVRVELTRDRRPVTADEPGSLGIPVEPYADWSTL